MAVKRKVKLSALAGAGTVILAWLVEDFGGMKIPGAVSSALTTLISFGTGYAFKETVEDDTSESDK